MSIKTLAILFTGTLLGCCATTFAANEPLRVVSLNMAGVTDVHAVWRDIDRIPDTLKIDLFVLQEVSGSADGSTSMAKEMGKHYAMNYMFKAADPIKDGLMEGLAVVSRYPIHDMEIIQLQHINLHFKSRDRIAMAVTLDAPTGPIRLINVHLDSRINWKQRMEQLKPVLEAADKEKLPVMLAGDFNTEPILWVGHTVPIVKGQNQVTPLETLMTSHHFTTPFGAEATFPLLHQKLDWIFLKGLKVTHSGVTPIASSDHNAIWIRLAADQPASVSMLRQN
jgi:endonuclease/exonuclease/phosphatase family metal-dependent hydrolase